MVCVSNRTVFLLYLKAVLLYNIDIFINVKLIIRDSEYYVFEAPNNGAEYKMRGRFYEE